MCDRFFNNTIRIAVAQMCQTIGYSTSQTTSMEILQDILHKFLHELSREMRRQVEHDNRTDANLTDVCQTLKNLHIDLNEIMDYMANVEPVPFYLDIPVYPVKKHSNLNFLKPGSKEVLTRPVHVYEYLPPILPVEPTSFIQAANAENLNKNDKEINVKSCSDQSDMDIFDKMYINKTMIGNESATPSSLVPPLLRMLDEEGRPTREISSVVMTTGGFLSPAIEGKLPVPNIPDAIEKFSGLDAPPPPTPPQPPQPPQPPLLTSSIENDMLPLNATIKQQQADIEIKELSENVCKTFVANQNDSKLAMQIALQKSGGTTNNLTTKKNSFIQQPNLPPTVASKLLKKAKRKNSSSSTTQLLNTLGNKFQRNDNVLSMMNAKTEKSNRKYLKKLQKISRTATGGIEKAAAYANQCDGDTAPVFAGKKCKELINADLVTALPYGPERFHMEKLLKKQLKHKEKIIKKQQQQLSKDMQRRVLEKIKYDQNYSRIEKQSKNEILCLVNETKNKKQQQQDGEGDDHSMKDYDPKNLLQQTTKSEIGNSQLNALTLQATLYGIDKSLPDIKNDQLQLLPTFTHKLSKGIKLSMEPNRSKLNIFKKISKQKTNTTTLTENNILTQQFFNCHENHFINLPTGTTITPAAPQPCGQDNENLTITTANTASTNLQQPEFLSKLNCGDTQPQMSSGPKKRGRKPGSKNQVKTAIATSDFFTKESKANKKKQKRIQTLHNACVSGTATPHVNMATDNTLTASEPLNLSNVNQFEMLNEYVSKLPIGILNTTQSLYQPPQIKTKEKKKLKSKNASAVTAALVNAGHNILHTNSKQLVSKAEEEVISINKKLSRMDTELKPDLKVLPSSITAFNDYNKFSHTQQKNELLINQKLNFPMKRLPAHGDFSTNTGGVKIPPFLAPNVGNFKNFQGKMLPIMPFYPFATQPGLIPTPNLFGPSNLGSFSHKAASDAANNMLLPRFLSYPTFKQQQTPDKLSTKGNTTDVQNSSTVLPTLTVGGDRNYCNVAPLVPESMKLLSSDTKQFSNEQANLKTTKSLDFSLVGEKKSDEISVKSFESLKEIRSNFQTYDKLKYDKIMQNPVTGTAIQAVTQTELTDLKMPKAGSDVCEILGKASNTITSTLENEPFTYKKNSMDIQMPLSSGTTTATAPIHYINEKPIEVSDESVDDGGTISYFPTLAQENVVQHVPPPLDTIAIKNLEIMATNIRGGDLKKQKKIKQTKKHIMPNQQSSTNIILDIFGVENKDMLGGKLAGGADLIPVCGGTGMAYGSSKEIPTTSLTATSTTVYNVTHKNNFDSSNHMLNFSIMPNTQSDSDLQKKHKEHKKLKKLKDGRIKKKKDKKDKTKNKLKMEHHMNIEKKICKEKHIEKSKERDFLKKFKREKKKEKQLTITQNMLPPSFLNETFAAEHHDMTAASAQKTHTSCGAKLSPNAVAASADESNDACLVPRLTLKLSACESTEGNFAKKEKTEILTANTTTEKREPSPELARISPFITRPPKQKIATGDNTTASTATRSSGSNTSIDNISSDNTKTIKAINTSALNQILLPPPSPWSSGGTITASSVLLPQQLSKTVKPDEYAAAASMLNTVKLTEKTQQPIMETKNPVPQITETSRPSSYIDAEGNRVWICPACGKVDDGSAMIGCDGCDAWYHWLCVGIFVAPKENEDWFCRVCITRKKTLNLSDRKRKRNKKK